MNDGVSAVEFGKLSGTIEEYMKNSGDQLKSLFHQTEQTQKTILEISQKLDGLSTKFTSHRKHNDAIFNQVSRQIEELQESSKGIISGEKLVLKEDCKKYAKSLKPDVIVPAYFKNLLKKWKAWVVGVLGFITLIGGCALMVFKLAELFIKGNIGG